MPPFYSRNRDRLFQKILQAELRIPRYFSVEATSLLMVGVSSGDHFLISIWLDYTDPLAVVQGLLNRDPAARLGSEDDGAAVRAHPFFRDVDWGALLRKQITPPFQPAVKDLRDTQNFDAEFTAMPVESLDSKPKHDGMDSPSVSGGRFYGFTFVNADVSASLSTRGSQQSTVAAM